MRAVGNLHPGAFPPQSFSKSIQNSFHVTQRQKAAGPSGSAGDEWRIRVLTDGAVVGGSGVSCLLLLLLLSLLRPEVVVGLLTVPNPADFFHYGGSGGVVLIPVKKNNKNHSVVTFRGK